MATDASECKQFCGMPLLTDLAVMMRIDPLARAELGRAEGAERAGQRR